jgi:hypothetical protein
MYILSRWNPIRPKVKRKSPSNRIRLYNHAIPFIHIQTESSTSITSTEDMEIRFHCTIDEVFFGISMPSTVMSKSIVRSVYWNAAFVFWISTVPDPERVRELMVTSGSEDARRWSIRLLVLAKLRFQVGPMRQGSGLGEETAVQDPVVFVGGLDGDDEDYDEDVDGEDEGVAVGNEKGTVMAIVFACVQPVRV